MLFSTGAADAHNLVCRCSHLCLLHSLSLLSQQENRTQLIWAVLLFSVSSRRLQHGVSRLLCCGRISASTASRQCATGVGVGVRRTSAASQCSAAQNLLSVKRERLRCRRRLHVWQLVLQILGFHGRGHERIGRLVGLHSAPCTWRVCISTSSVVGTQRVWRPSAALVARRHACHPYRRGARRLVGITTVKR